MLNISRCGMNKKNEYGINWLKIRSIQFKINNFDNSKISNFYKCNTKK